MTKHRTLLVVTLALLLVFVAAQVIGAQSRATLGWVVADRVTVKTGGIVTAGDITAQADMTLSPGTTIAVTMNGYITPTSSYQPLSSAGTVNTVNIAAGEAGDFLILENTSATSIVFTDTGVLKLGGTRTLGQYDTLTLVSDGTNWIELVLGNN